jgi:hypothetical protein
MYMEKGCEGDYVTLQGHNKELRNSRCLVLHGGLSTNITDEDVSCRYWVDGGLNWKSCDDSPKTRPASWKMINGLCTVVDNDKCDNYNSIGQTYGWRGKGGEDLVRMVVEEAILRRSTRCSVMSGRKVIVERHSFHLTSNCQIYHSNHLNFVS